MKFGFGQIKESLARKREINAKDRRARNGLPEDMPRPTEILEADEDWERSRFDSEAVRFQKAIQDIQGRLIALENDWMETGASGRKTPKPSNEGPVRRTVEELKNRDLTYLNQIIEAFETRRFDMAEKESKRYTIYQNAIWTRDKVQRFISSYPELVG